MENSLLVEIGVEELPAIPFLKELPNIKDKWRKVLKSYDLDSDFEFFYTPRRLIFVHKSFKSKQNDKEEILYGAPLSIAFKDGNPTPAAVGFAKKCGVSVDEISKCKRGDKEVLCYHKNIKGEESSKLLPKIIKEFLNSLEFGKSMRWGNGKDSFIRPIRWIGVLLGKNSVDFDIFGVSSKANTYVHRTKSFKPYPYKSVEEFFDILEKNYVIYDQDRRKEIILSQFKDIEKKHSCNIEIDSELLAEVVAITEYPNSTLGEFDKEFLTLPPEVIITSMKEHQRYFPVYKEKKLSNHFVVVTNSISDDLSLIKAGNEKVLRARLSDALFFWENDLKKPLDPTALKSIIFMNELGSMYDKELREAKIAEYLNNKFKVDDNKLINKAVMLSKADLVTDMVYEFTELQGIMGYYYALEENLDKKIAFALKEQYLPDGEDSSLPSSDFSAIVALSYKIDSLLALFSIGKIPTGTKDPFGLRRAVVGIYKIIIDRKFDLGFSDLKNLSKNYKEFDFKKLENFIKDRIVGFYDINPSIVWAVLHSKEDSLLNIDKKINALYKITKKENFKEINSTFKRVANIVKDMDLEKDLVVDENLFNKDEERRLYEHYKLVNQKEYNDYEQKLEALFGLKDDIDSFFDNVLVNDKDESIKQNRKSLIGAIYKSFKSIADIKEISI